MEKKKFTPGRVLTKVPFLKNFLEKTGIWDNRENEREYRTIFINNVKPDNYSGEMPLNYTNNTIVTSKYTLLNFLPKNLYEQFRRFANFYFLINIVAMFITPEPPKNPVTSLIPLLMVILFTAVKQAYEDVLRHKSDREVNKTSVRVLRDGTLKMIKRQEICCGDIVQVKSNISFPCDILLLYTETEDRTCFITTANLDGETNLKPRSVPEHLTDIGCAEDLVNYRGVIRCDKPNIDLYDFKGNIVINNSEYPLRKENILLRGATLKIAPCIYGCAIYTGKDTKLMLNSKFKSSKLSCIERTLNRFIIFFLFLLATMTIICLVGSLFYADIYKKHWYLKNTEPKFFVNQKVIYYIIEVLFYLSLFSNIIPISMYISIETQRFIGTKFFEWDIKMYDEETNQPAKANSSDINEDLGQIEYLFSDKTGTLTENEMVFKQFSIGNTLYQFQNNQVYAIGAAEPTRIQAILHSVAEKRFFEVLSLCHTVQLDLNALERYQASSPDEFSFIKFCEKVGIVFLGDSKQPNKRSVAEQFSAPKVRTVRFLDAVCDYALLHTLEFDADRKRMSVVVRCEQTGAILLLCKGAESSIFPKCPSQSAEIARCNDLILDFSLQGWRTLALAYRVLSPHEYAECRARINDAYSDIQHREERLSAVYDAYESGLTLIGATAVEDRLQAEVPATLEALRTAGIKIWVLTGDKIETAINISDACKHFAFGAEKLLLTGFQQADNIETQLKLHEKQIRKQRESKSFAYIIDGQTLGLLFKHKLDILFRDVCMQCDAVLCCRMSPSQKAAVVKLVKTSRAKPITCAIGDGANDVSMIQEAHIGFGIYGKEGRNAARSSDFAFAKFRHVKRAILVHGYLYYTRLTTLVHYFFYKNVAFVICQMLYASSNAFSVQSLYHSIFIIFYNIFFTSFPIIVYGIFEQKTMIDELENNPKLYRTIAQNKLLSLSQFVKWNILGLWHALVAYYSTFLLFEHGFISPRGLLNGGNEYGAIVFIQVVILVHLKLLTEWRSVNFISVLSYFLSLFAFIVWCLIPNSFIAVHPITVITENQNFYWTFYQILSYPSVWLCILLTATTAIIPDLFIKIIENLRSELRIRKLEELEKIRKVYLHDVPRHHSEQKRKRSGLQMRKKVFCNTYFNDAKSSSNSTEDRKSADFHDPIGDSNFKSLPHIEVHGNVASRDRIIEEEHQF